MAGSWPLTTTRRRALAGAALAARPAAALWRGARRLVAGESRPPLRLDRVLVVESRQLGDVVMATAALAALRRAAPEAHLTLLARPHAATLLDASGLADAVIGTELPWAGGVGRHRERAQAGRELALLLRELRRRRFDASFQVRGDPREDLLLLAAAVRRRFGFDFGPNAVLLTDAAPPPLGPTHRVQDWHRLLALADIDAGGVGPRLAIRPDEDAAAAAELAAAGVRRGDLVVGIHPGASRDVRRWPLARFGEVADALAARHGAKVVVFADPDGYGAAIADGRDAVLVRPDLRRLLGLLRQCDVVVCNDSGPMHMAAALGVPVAAVFTSQRPDWYGPWGTGHAVAAISDVACRPCFDRCRFAEPHCNTRLTTDAVLAAVEGLLAARAAETSAVSPDAPEPRAGWPVRS